MENARHAVPPGDAVPKRKRPGLADGGDKGNALAKNKKDTMRYQGKMYDEKK